MKNARPQTSEASALDKRNNTPPPAFAGCLSSAEDFDTLPTEMRDARRWLVWKSVPNDDPTKKPRKVPYYVNGVARHGALDSPSDIAQLGTFTDALLALNTGRYTGLGFALGPDGTGSVWQGIDLDDIPNRPTLGYIAEDMPGYTEVSPSGNGMHGIGYGRPFDSLGSNSTGIEAYSSGRFFTVTADGAGIHPPTDIADFVERRLAPMHRGRQESPTNEVQAIEVLSPLTISELRSALLHMRSDDRELWVRIGHALKTLGDVGRGLWLDWSATSALFDPKADAKTWDGFKPTRTGHPAVFAEAQKQGWVNPASKAASLPTTDTSAAATKPAGFTFVQAHDLLFKPEPVPWLIDRMIERGSLSTLFGASGCGKSFVTIDMGCCISTGTMWHGKATEPGAVFYIAGEGHAGIRRRLKAWEIHSGTSLQDAPLFISTCPAALMDEGSALAVATAAEALVAEHGVPTLFIVDTLARNLGNGDENSNADIGVFINNIDVRLRMRFGATVLIVHHTGWTDKERGRGASAMRAAMDSEYRLDFIGDIRSLVCTKAKESEILTPMNFTLEQIVLNGWADADGELMTSAVLVSTAETPNTKPKGLTGANRICLDALAHALQAEGKAPTEPLRAAMGMFAPQRVVTEEVWRQRAYAEGISDGEQDAKKKAFGRSRKALLDMKKVSTWEGDYWLGDIAPDGVKVEKVEEAQSDDEEI